MYLSKHKREFSEEELRNAKLLKFFLPFVDGKKRALLFFEVALFVIGLYQSLYSWIIGQVTGAFTEKNFVTAAILFGGYTAGSYLLSLITRKLSRREIWIMTKIIQRAALNKIKDVWNSVSKLFNKFSSSDILQRTNNINVIDSILDKITGVTYNSIEFVILIVFLSFTDWRYIIFVAIYSIGVILTTKYYVPKLIEAKDREEDSSAEVTQLKKESLMFVKDVRALGIFDSLYKDIEERIKTKNEIHLEKQDISLGMTVNMGGLRCLFLIGAVLFTIYLGDKGIANVAFFTAILGYLGRLQQFSNDICRFFGQMIPDSKNTVLRIQQLDSEGQMVYGDKEIDPNSIKSVEFRNICKTFITEKELTSDQIFQHNNNTLKLKDNEELFIKKGIDNEDILCMKITKNVLRNLNLTLEAGKISAICGKSGEGKSTLLDLLARWTDPDSGEIILHLTSGESVNLHSLSKECLISCFTMATQSSKVFTGSFRSNFEKIQEYKRNPELMDMACEMAEIKNDILERGGYDSLIEESAKNISGGQQQRLTLARIFMRALGGCRIIVMDEGTANLDNITQANIQNNALRKLADMGCVVVTVSHRTATIKPADKIVVVKKGVVLDEGTHNELSERCEHYVSLTKED